MKSQQSLMTVTQKQDDKELSKNLARLVYENKLDVVKYMGKGYFNIDLLLLDLQDKKAIDKATIRKLNATAHKKEQSA